MSIKIKIKEYVPSFSFVLVQCTHNRKEGEVINQWHSTSHSPTPEMHNQFDPLVSRPS